MANIKVKNTSLDQNLNGTNFNNTASETIFSFGSFSLTSNFSGRVPIDYSNQLSTFVRPVTLETLGYTPIQSEIIYDKTVNAVLNLDNSDLNTFVKFGSTYDFFRVCVENIILEYPGSLYVNGQAIPGGNTTYYDYSYDELYDISTFKIPLKVGSGVNPIVNTFGLIYNYGNTATPDNNEIKNVNLSYDKYIIWSSTYSNDYTHTILDFVGFNPNVPSPYVIVSVNGNVFPDTTGNTGEISFHVRPNNVVFDEFRELLVDYEKYMMSERDGINGFRFIVNEPSILDDGTIKYNSSNILWSTLDGYNIDINNSSYEQFLSRILTIGQKYDTVKTDLIARFLTPSSLKTYDLTDEAKMTKLLRIYGKEFDQIKKFIDSLVYINKVTYDKKNNIPDQLVSNLARTFGWQYFSLVNETELVTGFLNVDDTERNLNTDLLPAEVDIELWRRILMNTNYFWKSKGTRQAIKSMFMLIGIPEPFINITEYVYTVDGRIDPREVTLSQADFPSNSLPYDNSGYPKAPLETGKFYFQVSGDTDGGQAYMNVFRKAGFTLLQTVDNKKSWIQTGATTRIHYSTPQYYQEDSKLILNTKEVDIALDTARGIEYDVFYYTKNVDFPANSSGYTLPYKYVNISLGLTGATQTKFKLPSQFSSPEGDLEVRFNGILLNAPKLYTGGTGTTDETTEANYSVSGDMLTLTNGVVASLSNNNRDVIEATYLYSGASVPVSGVSIKYLVSRIDASLIGTTIPLPSNASGDVQITINGIALTKGTSQFNADYIINPNNSSEIVIQNPEVIAYLAINPYVQVAYVTVTGSTSIEARNELFRVDSFATSKLYYNDSANKYVYKLNYKLNNVSDAKVLINGIALEPGTDYTLNSSNPYEIYLPAGITYGTVISVYYLVGGNDYFDPIVSNDFGVGDISQLSFLEFIELVQRRMINATNRKTITDFKGGWYPTLLKIYVDYLKRANLPQVFDPETNTWVRNPLESNGYTFENLYPFLSKYNAFFQRFVDQLLSATIIVKKGGLLIRNSIFTKQKFAYKRGVYMGATKYLGYGNNATTFYQDRHLAYFGDDGSTFLKRPLFQNVQWSDDFVCVNDLCSNFIVTGVTITYPTTTTTTTAFPYQAVMTINEVDSEQTPLVETNRTGTYASETHRIAFNPPILPGYVISSNFIFTSKLSGGTDNDSIARAVITIKKNGSTIFTVTNEKNIISSDIVNSYSVSIRTGDIIDVVLENTAMVVEGSGDYCISKILFAPVITNVTPNGRIPSIVPPSILSYVSEGPVISTGYGRLYNWYALNDSRNIAPEGWHVATDADWTTLTTYLLGESVAGGKLKETGTLHWLTPNTDATDEVAFTALPGGFRGSNADFYYFGETGSWWTGTQYSAGDAWYRSMFYSSPSILSNNGSKWMGLSVRLVKNDSNDTGKMTGNDGKIYDTVKIGDQVWLARDLDETKYRTGAEIQEVTDATSWLALTSGAWCFYNNVEPTY